MIQRVLNMEISNIFKDNGAVVSYMGVADFEDVAYEAVVYESVSYGFITIDRNHKMANIVHNNYLNLPVRIEFDSGHAMENNYDADGNLIEL